MEAAASTEDKPCCLILDANVWVAERLLQSSIGSALLYAVTSAGAIIALPEVVELEINEVLTAQAEGAGTKTVRSGARRNTTSRRRGVANQSGSCRVR
jgi:hypothetical protein